MIIMTPIGALKISCSDKALRSITCITSKAKISDKHNDSNLNSKRSNTEFYNTNVDILDKHRKSSSAEELEKRVAIWVKSYFANTSIDFPTDIPLDPDGTEFQKQVWEELRKIPYGETKTYGEIAKRIGKPGSARAVGNGCGKNHILLAIPCHRVVGSSGIGGFALGLATKRKLLAIEGRLNL